MPDQQQQINYGAAPNDGQGDPLRDAFIKTDDNFDAIWAAGPVGSNITILNNTVTVVNTNGNLVLRPNGVGVIQANASVVPDSANIRDLGASDRRWRRVYLQTLNTVDYEVEGDLTVSGNLTIQGNTIQIGNLITDARTLQLANTATTSEQANGSGITVGSADDIATMLYDSTADAWQFNIGVTSAANITAGYFLGDGSELTGMYGDDDVIDLLADLGSDDISTLGNITAGYFIGDGSQLTGLPEAYGNANVADYLPTYDGNLAGAALSIQNGVGNTWLIYQDSISAPSGGEWRSENDSLDDYITSAADGYINLQSLFADGNIASELKLEHGVARLVLANAPFKEWTFLNTGTLEAPGDIIPSANGVYSLGNATNYWSNLFVASNTIYIGGVPLGITGNTLTVNGEALLSNNSNTSITTTGNITADYFIGDGSQLTNLPFDASQIENGTSNVAIATANGNVTVTANSTQTWTFGTSGNLQFPDGTTYTGSEIDSPTVPTVGGTASAGEAGITYLSGDLSKWAIFTEGAFTVGVWTDVQVGWTVTDNNGFTDIIAGRGSFGAASFQTTVNSWPAPASGKTYVFTSPDYQLGYTNPVEITVGNDTWTFGNTSTLTLPGGSRISPLGANLDIFAGTGSYVNLITSDESSSMGVDNGGGYIVTAGGTWGFSTTGNLTAPGNISAVGNITGAYILGNGSQLTGLPATYGNSNVATFLAAYGSNTISTTGNVTGGNLISSATIYGNVDVVLGNIANVSGTKTRMVTDTTFSYIQTGNGTIGSTGNIVFSPYSSPTQQVVIDTANGNLTAAGNVTAQNFVGNIQITGNVTGTSANVDLVAGAYEWTFDNTGNLTLPGNTFAVNYASGSPVNVVTKFESTWTAPVGNSTQSFTVDANNTYYMWVVANIPNGIITWNATATITNTNVPVVGAQYAWVYDGAGTPIDFTSIPNQFVGTANTIVRSNVSPSVTTNRFDFGINNTSGSPQTVRYGWIRIS